jgi:hypothetical protein
MASPSERSACDRGSKAMFLWVIGWVTKNNYFDVRQAADRKNNFRFFMENDEKHVMLTLVG